ncbi:squamosa promoter-binding 1 [Olea europaea subsp. europaea]|uniref:Squamosa promoter-binding 1 n=1 Tax=Olea europaea subsp. europaea TaxID=158383 RepID=A0A8S0U1N0_OLEEU|nr:squamosa promoter-binding 1 [Olea europaea subsp. europaea]
MEARLGCEAPVYYGMGSASLRMVGQRSLEWDPRDWKWDGDLFLATPINPNLSNCQSRQFLPLETGITTTGGSSNRSFCSEELNNGTLKEKNDLDKKRRLIVVEDDNLTDEVGSVALQLFNEGNSRMERGEGSPDKMPGKKTKFTGATSSRAVCQVEDCGAELSKAKEYHRRHKVCEMHSKANKALVGGVMQRFCQQCSRFHALQEFDEGKRSCRRRLAGHNKRRRKTQPDNDKNNSPMNDNQTNGYLLMSLLKILTDMHSSRLNNKDDQDLLSHLLQSFASHGNLQGERNISGLLQESQNVLRSLPCMENSESVLALLSNGSRGQRQHSLIPADDMPKKDKPIQSATSQRPDIAFPVLSSSPAYEVARDNSAGRSKLNNFDLNDVYVDSDEGTEDVERLPTPVDLGAGSREYSLWAQQESHQSSPRRTSGNSDSASAPSPSCSSGDAQSRTDRIVCKLFGKQPSDFPIFLRSQIFDWLSHSPSDIESYIRPGCIILTIYLRQSESAWKELCRDLSSSLSRVLGFSNDDTFWSTGWIYIRVQNQIAFAFNGNVVVDTTLPFSRNNHSTILCVKPIAVPSSERAQFVVKGFNLSRPSARLLCSIEGNYLEGNKDSLELVDGLEGNVQCLNLSCSIPAVTGRGFIEVEDHGLSSSFFPFIVAEDDVCTEICTLEREIELAMTGLFLGGTGKLEAHNQAMDFIHEMGWLLHRNSLKSRLGHLDPNSDCFPFERFKYLMEFSVDHDWCAVVNKLLGILFSGIVGAGEQPFLKFALHEMGLLHRAVRKNSRPLVELLLKYAPESVADELNLEHKSLVESHGDFLFRPDVVGPAGLTPLHVAAGRDGSEDILDALTDDPGKLGIEAWKSARDSTGYTPEDYARLRGHYSYIHLVQKKINKKVSSGHVVVDISGTLSDGSINQKQNGGVTTGFEIGRNIRQSCRVCDQKLAYGIGRRSLVYRPAMLSMVAIAAVCVCVALLFKSSPEVLFVFSPFRWEMLDYGSG